MIYQHHLTKPKLKTLGRWEILQELRKHVWPDSYQSILNMPTVRLRQLLESYARPVPKIAS